VIAALAVSISLALAPTLAAAHPVVADGVTTEWSARTTPFANQGVIARDATSTGEYIFVDAATDERTDLTAGAAARVGARASEIDTARAAITPRVDIGADAITRVSNTVSGECGRAYDRSVIRATAA
jgi:hypothetical protein